jgi:hypothetical protein
MSNILHRLTVRVAAVLAAVALTAALAGLAQAKPPKPPPTPPPATCSLAGKTYNPGDTVNVTVKGKHGTETREYVCTSNGGWRRLATISTRPTDHVTVTTRQLLSAIPGLAQRTR